MSTEIPVPINTPEIDKAERVNAWLGRVGLVIAVATLALVALLLLFRFGDSAKQSTAQKSVSGILASARRNDCRSAYNSDRNAVVEKANALERQANIDFAGYLLSDPDVTVAVLGVNKAALEEANQAVLTLLPLNVMVDKGYELNGMTHPPCPIVK